MPWQGGNSVEKSTIAGDNVQIGEVHGDVTIGRRDSLITPVQRSETWKTGRRRLGVSRVSGADPVRLGVHKAIRGSGLGPDAMPTYVTRDLDTQPCGGLRGLIQEAAAHNGFVTLIGGSSVGKSRSLYEAVRKLLPNWWLYHPANGESLGDLIELSPRRLIIWLDELQNYLDGERGLTAAVIRGLLTPPHQVIILATLWPHFYSAYTAPHTTANVTDQYAAERNLLKLATVVHVDSRFTAAERDRAAAAAVEDDRLGVALASEDFGFTQVMAAAPELIHRWRSADPYARAVMTAAVDATIMGVRSAVPEDLLRASAPGYCSPQERGSAPARWFEEALAYATQPLLGATSPLIGVSGGTAMGRRDGYQVADFLRQHVGAERREKPPPQTFWQACADHLVQADDVARVGESAYERQRFGAASPLLRRAALAGVPSAMHTLARLSAAMRDAVTAKEMTDRLAASDEPLASFYRAELAFGDVDELLDLVEQGNEPAAEMIIEYGDPALAMALLRRRLDSLDDLGSWCRLAELLADEGRRDQAVEIFDMLIEREYDEAALPFAEILKETENRERLRQLTDLGYFDAAVALATLLIDQGEAEEAIDVLWEFADERNIETDSFLAGMLRDQGRLGELLELAEYGSPYAAAGAADVLRRRGEVEEAIAVLTPFADAGEIYAMYQLAALLAETGRAEHLRARVDAGDKAAADALMKSLLGEGRLDEAVRLEAQLTTSFRLEDLVRALVEHGEADKALELLRVKADTGEAYWTWRLADLLKQMGKADELRARIDRGDAGAARRLYEMLVEQGRAQEAQLLTTSGLSADGEIRLATAPFKQCRDNNA